MSILERDRKLLWGRAANRCSICRKELSLTKSDLDDESIIGEECHIVSKKENGPRFRIDYDFKKVDSYQNIILLCRNHHKQIDDKENEYSEKVLLKIKNDHEQWVTENLNSKNIKPIRIVKVEGQNSELLYRINNANSLIKMFNHICASYFYNDELENEDEVELVGGFLQEIRDYGDIYDDLEPISVTRSTFQLTNMIREIEEAGFWIFGNVEKRKIQGGTLPPADWNVLYINVVRNTNPNILTIDLNDLKDA